MEAQAAERRRKYCSGPYYIYIYIYVIINVISLFFCCCKGLVYQMEIVHFTYTKTQITVLIFMEMNEFIKFIDQVDTNKILVCICEGVNIACHMKK